MTRHFGIPTSRPVDLEGASTVDRALSRAGAARDLYEADRNLRENVTAGFVAVFLAPPAIFLYVACKLVDWPGVGEWIGRLADQLI